MSSYVSINPATGEPLAQYDEISDTHLDTMLELSAAAYSSWKATAVDRRRMLLTRVSEIYREQADELARIVTLEMGKPISQAVGEIELSASIYAYYAEHAEQFLADEPLTIAGTGTAVVRTEPIGSILGVMPWNYPHYQVARFAAPNIALGNAVVVKHAHSCPRSALAIEQIHREAGLPDGVYLNAFISTEQVATSIADARIRGVSVTGSERAGAAVGAVAGRYFKKVVFELGGSDPFVVLDDADVGAAATAAIAGRLTNGGQACTASKRFIVAERIYDEFVGLLVEGMSTWEPGDPTLRETKLGPLASPSAAAALNDIVQQAISSGAQVLLGGAAPDGSWYRPTVLAHVTRDMRAYREELFGPVAVVHRASSVDQAIEIANDSPFGLAASIFTSSPDRAERVAHALEVGMVWINSTSKTAPDLPFGGVKASGVGRELSRAGFHEFSNQKLLRKPHG